MTARLSLALWIVASLFAVAWWTVLGLFVFGAIGPVSDDQNLFLVFSALFSTIGTGVAASFPRSDS